MSMEKFIESKWLRILIVLSSHINVKSKILVFVILIYTNSIIARFRDSDISNLPFLITNNTFNVSRSFFFINNRRFNHLQIQSPSDASWRC